MYNSAFLHFFFKCYFYHTFYSIVYTLLWLKYLMLIHVLCMQHGSVLELHFTVQSFIVWRMLCSWAIWLTSMAPWCKRRTWCEALFLSQSKIQNLLHFRWTVRIWSVHSWILQTKQRDVVSPCVFFTLHITDIKWDCTSSFVPLNLHHTRQIKSYCWESSLSLYCKLTTTESL